ncbi:MAG: hypothetical protein JOY67_20415 [Hyphomicrobiales bacterium]|nr:hypothetical protein [Hyphomicrobiales bacterium]
MTLGGKLGSRAKLSPDMRFASLFDLKGSMHDPEKWKPLFRKGYARPMIQCMVATLIKAGML